MNKKALLHALSTLKIHVALRYIYRGYSAILVLHRVIRKDAGSMLPSLQELELSPVLFESMIQMLIDPESWAAPRDGSSSTTPGLIHLRAGRLPRSIYESGPHERSY